MNQGMKIIPRTKKFQKNLEVTKKVRNFAPENKRHWDMV